MGIHSKGSNKRSLEMNQRHEKEAGLYKKRRQDCTRKGGRTVHEKEAGLYKKKRQDCTRKGGRTVQEQETGLYVNLLFFCVWRHSMCMTSIIILYTNSVCTYIQRITVLDLTVLRTYRIRFNFRVV